MGLKDLGKKLKISQRPLEIIYVIDTSGSMEGAKIQSVNNAMHELEFALRNEARNNPTAQVNIRIITFGGSCAKWHLGTKTPVESFTYKDINYVDGMTPMGSAFNLLCDTLDNAHIPNRSLRPIVVLLSDGWPNDNYERNLNRFLNLPWGKKAIKIAIAIGRDADKDILGSFTQDPTLVLEANNPTSLVNFIKWTSTLVSHSTQHTTQQDDNGRMRTAAIVKPDTVLTDEGDFV